MRTERSRGLRAPPGSGEGLGRPDDRSQGRIGRAGTVLYIYTCHLSSHALQGLPFTAPRAPVVMAGRTQRALQVARVRARGACERNIFCVAGMALRIAVTAAAHVPGGAATARRILTPNSLQETLRFCDLITREAHANNPPCLIPSRCKMIALSRPPL